MQCGRFLGGGRSSVGRVPDCDSGCRGFESHRPPHPYSFSAVAPANFLRSGAFSQDPSTAGVFRTRLLSCTLAGICSVRRPVRSLTFRPCSISVVTALARKSWNVKRALPAFPHATWSSKAPRTQPTFDSGAGHAGALSPLSSWRSQARWMPRAQLPASIARTRGRASANGTAPGARMASQRRT